MARSEAYTGPSTEIAQELYDAGLIGLVNESALHRYGYALGVVVDDTGTVTELTLQQAADPDGYYFDEESILAMRAKLRAAGLLGP